jgi:hypothetical protein
VGMSVPMRATTTTVLALAATALAGLPAAASAATKPTASTGAAANATYQSASLAGTVDPEGTETSWFFQYGPTIAYGSSTPATSAGAGTANRHVVANIAALAPATRYHYRLVAQSAAGTALGADRTFTTARQPLGFTIAATPNPVLFGAATTVAGTLSGTGAADREVVLEQKPFPYTGPFAQIGNAQITSPAGAFSFPGLIPLLNTQFRVMTTGKPKVTSPIVTAGVAVRVSTSTSATRVRRGGIVRFSGHVRPARDGAQVGVQKLNRQHHWVTVSGTILHHASASSSRYAKRVHIRRGGSYRIFVLITDGNYVSNTGRTVHLHTR